MKNIVELFFRDLTSLGGLFFYAIVVALFFSLGLVDMAWHLIFVGVVINIVAVLIRAMYFKQRPIHQKHSSFWTKIDASSFPSIHAARSVTLAIVLGKYFMNVYISLLVVVLAVIVCYSRYYLKKHDGADIAAGAVLGALVGIFL